MRLAHRSIIIIVGVVLSFGNSSGALAAPTLQTGAPLGITIITAQTETIVGAPMTWRVILTPHGEQSIGPIELRPGDTRVWAWPDGIQTISAITKTVVLDVSAVPLVSGELTSAIEARYTVGKEMQTQLVVADTSVCVEPVETHIEVGVIAHQGTAWKKAPLPVELWIHNRSPFTLTQVHVQGNGADLAWGAGISLEDISPGKISRPVLTPTVVGEHPQPQLSVGYGWEDGVGIPHTQTLYVSGEAVALVEGIAGKIPYELLGVVAGVFTGALATIIPGWIQEKRSRKRQERVTRQHVRGLLRLMTLQSEHAADNGMSIRLEPLETIFEEEGLFAVMEEDGLAEYARDLWKTAKRHNDGLNLPGGAQRSEELRKAAGELSKKLDAGGAG